MPLQSVGGSELQSSSRFNYGNECAQQADAKHGALMQTIAKRRQDSMSYSYYCFSVVYSNTQHTNIQDTELYTLFFFLLLYIRGGNKTDTPQQRQRASRKLAL